MDIETKKCSKCDEVKELSEFALSKTTKDLRHAWCKPCLNAYRKNYIINNRDKVKQQKHKCRIKHIEKNKEYGKKRYQENIIKCRELSKEYREKYPDKTKIAVKKWRDANLDYSRQKLREYKKQNPHVWNEDNSFRRAQRLKATPTWVTEEQKEKIKLLYKKAKELEKETNDKYHVDHIIPLINDRVCGLHVLSNLRIITATENLSKSNKLIEV